MPRKPCVHHWVLGEALSKHFSTYVHGREARCRKCRKKTVLREREFGLVTLKEALNAGG